MSEKSDRWNYIELLRDPRWQRKRLEIMERDGFACVSCGDNKFTLNVHHKYYEKGLMPWEYPNEVLGTLCEYCHTQQHDADLELRKSLALLDENDLMIAEAFIKGLFYRKNQDIPFKILSPWEQEGYGAAFNVSYEILEQCLDGDCVTTGKTITEKINKK